MTYKKIRKTLFTLILCLSVILLTGCTVDRAKTAGRYTSKVFSSLFGNSVESRTLDYNKKFPIPEPKVFKLTKINSNINTDLQSQVYQSQIAPKNISLYKDSDLDIYKPIFYSPKQCDISESKYKKQIQLMASEMKKNPYLFILIEGHCDINGTQTYNMSLGNERVQNIKNLLQSYGVNEKQIKTISYGKDYATGHENKALKLHRKCAFKVYSARNW